MKPHHNFGASLAAALITTIATVTVLSPPLPATGTTTPAMVVTGAPTGFPPAPVGATPQHDNVELAEAIARAEVAERQLEQIRAHRDRLRAKHQAARAELDRLDRTLADLDALWFAGYTAGGGTSHNVFAETILPCESGGSVSPHTVVGPTDDWGRAQINRPVWSARFEELTGVEFEVGIVDPVLNGYMAAVVEREHVGTSGAGLNAWVCFR